jgi:hypothetical protein
VFDRTDGVVTTGPFRGSMRDAAKWDEGTPWIESWVTAEHATAVLHTGGFTVIAGDATTPLHDLAGKPLALGFSPSGNWVAAALVGTDGYTRISIFAHRDERALNLLGDGDLLGGLDAGALGLDAEQPTPEQAARYAALKARCAGNCIAGHGSLSYPDGHSYSGTWVDGHPSGTGTLAANDGAWVYTGQVQGGKPHGHGRMTTAPGVFHEGRWSKGKRSGPGVGRQASGATYEGTFAFDAFVKGTVRHPDGRVEQR